MNQKLIEWVEDNEGISFPMLEAIWIMRWNGAKTAMAAVLTADEANKMCKDIVEELDKAGYQIVKKDE